MFYGDGDGFNAFYFSSALSSVGTRSSVDRSTTMSIVVPIDNTLPTRLNQIAGFIKLAMVHVGVVAKRSNIKGKRIE